MKLKIKFINIETGGPLIALIHKTDSIRFDINPGDRISIHKGKAHMILFVDVTDDKKEISPGYLGVYKEVLKEIKLKNKEPIEITEEHKPDSLKYIKKKVDGYNLEKEEISRIVKDLVHHHITPFEASYFVAGCYIHGMSLDESAFLTEAIVKNSKKLEIKSNGIIADKHCTGGVPNNRTTMIIVPILAAAGLKIPKTSTRSITSPAGTADTMEILAPVEHTKERIKEIVEKCGACIVWGGTRDLASADDLLIKLEKPLDLDPEGILLASILAKKSVVNSTHILIDLPVGQHAKHNKNEAKVLAKKFKAIGKKLKMIIKPIITNGEDIIGNGVGPALEAKDILEILSGKGPTDLKEKSIKLSNILLKMVKKKPIAREILESGKADKKMREIIKEQGGNSKIKSNDIVLGKFTYNYKSKRSGKIKEVNIKLISRIAKYAGAPTDKGAGIYMHKKLSDNVKEGEKLFTIYGESKDKLNYAKNEAEKNNIFVIKWF